MSEISGIKIYDFNNDYKFLNELEDLLTAINEANTEAAITSLLENIVQHYAMLHFIMFQPDNYRLAINSVHWKKEIKAWVSQIHDIIKTMPPAKALNYLNTLWNHNYYNETEQLTALIMEKVVKENELYIDKTFMPIVVDEVSADIKVLFNYIIYYTPDKLTHFLNIASNLYDYYEDGVNIKRSISNL